MAVASSLCGNIAFCTMALAETYLAGFGTDHRELTLAAYWEIVVSGSWQFSVGKRELLHDGIRKRFTRWLFC